MSKSATTVRQYLRIGQIAERSGVSAKALRLYEQRGLLKPCAHSEAGYRLYGPDALQRLMQIVVLKRSGFTLAQIDGLLSSAASTITTLLGERIEALQREMADKARTLQTLRAIARRVDSASTLSLDQLLESITMSNKAHMHAPDSSREDMLARAEKFRTALGPNQFECTQEQIVQRLDSLGADELEAKQRPWRELSVDIRAAMAAGKPASDSGVAELARRWHAWVTTVVAANTSSEIPSATAFITKMRELYLQHPELMVAQSMSPAMIDYLREAAAAVGLSFI
jgi:DNA-binding transcriptional MerR regulator